MTQKTNNTDPIKTLEMNLSARELNTVIVTYKTPTVLLI
jgi:hypothetical protein